MKKQADIIDSVIQTAIEELREEGWGVQQMPSYDTLLKWLEQYLYEVAIERLKDHFRDIRSQQQALEKREQDQEWRTSSKKEIAFNWS